MKCYEIMLHIIFLFFASLFFFKINMLFKYEGYLISTVLLQSENIGRSETVCRQFELGSLNHFAS